MTASRPGRPPSARCDREARAGARTLLESITGNVVRAEPSPRAPRREAGSVPPGRSTMPAPSRGCLGVTANDDQDRRRGDSPRAPSSTSASRRSPRRRRRVLLCSRIPRTPVDPSPMASRRSATPDHHEDPGLTVLGARGVGGRLEKLADHVVSDRLVAEPPVGALTVHHVEEPIVVRRSSWGSAS